MSKKPEDVNAGYQFVRAIVSPFIKHYYKPTIIGAENIPEDGALVIAGNHKHVLDQNFTMMSTKRTIHYMAKKEYFDGKLAPFFRLAGCIPVDRKRKDLSSTKSALKVLHRGGAIGIFPEGTRNKTEKFLLKFKDGAVKMAKKSDACILPFGLAGDYSFRSKNLTVVFGKPFKVTEMTIEEANEKLYNEISTLMLQAMGEKQTVNNRRGA